jgi:hypothetical protein
MPRLFHFSEEPGIELFVPREEQRRPDAPPVVWAIDEPHRFMYLFPRDCPRVLLWPVPGSSSEDIDRWFGRTDACVVAHVEYGWLDRIRSTTLYRYELPPATFQDLGDAGMWVSREPVTPTRVAQIGDLITALEAAGVELRLMPRLTPLHGLWETTTLHWSSIRMGNARDWGETQPTPIPEGFRRNPSN